MCFREYRNQILDTAKPAERQKKLISPNQLLIKYFSNGFDKEIKYKIIKLYSTIFIH